MSFRIAINDPQPSINKDAFLFHHHAFVKLRHKDLVSFTLNQANEAIAQVLFERQHHTLNSIPYAPFGGFDTNEVTTKAGMDQMVSEIISYAQNDTTIKNVEITLPAEIYSNSAFELWQQSLLDHQFVVKEQDTIQYLTINNAPFKQRIASDKRRYLNKSQHFRFEVLDHKYLEDVYMLIKEGREAKQYSLSVSFDNIEQLTQAFPDRVLLFGLFDSDELIASAITVKVNTNILYDFHHEELVEYRGKSPTVALIEGIYTYCQQNNFNLLDLGGSTLEGKINQGLFDFKKSLGAEAAVKKTFSFSC